MARREMAQAGMSQTGMSQTERSFVVKNVSYLSILRDLNLEWSGGQVVGLVGPNGAGKSTFMRLLAGVWRPTTGSIFLDGQSIESMPARRRAKDIAYLPQQLPENVSFTVEQYVEMGRYAYRTSWGGLGRDSYDAVQHALTSLNLIQYKEVSLTRLSGGERQRAGIARCLAQGSPIILLDEPIANLDLYYQLDILNRLQDLAGEGYLVVIAIHNLELAARYCDNLVLLHSGHVYAHGKPTEVLNERSLLEVFQVQAKTYADPFGGYLRMSHTGVID